MRDTGQIYIPFVNWGLFVAIVLAVVMFRSSSNLAAAYGIAVTLDMLITTDADLLRDPLRLEATRWRCASPPPAGSSSSTSPSSPPTCSSCSQGGWFPLLIGGAIFTLMITWKQGRAILNEKLQGRRDRPARASWNRCSSARRRACEGTAVFLTAEPGTVPNAMLHNLKHNKVLHEHNLFVTVRNHEVPWIGMDKRVEIEPLGHHCWQVIAALRLQERPRRAARAGADPRPRLRARADDDQLLPVARHRHPHHRQRHGALARKAVRADAPQRQRGGRLPEAAEQRGGGAGLERSRI